MDKKQIKKVKGELDDVLGDKEKELLKDIIHLLNVQNEKFNASDLTQAQKEWFAKLTSAISQIKLGLPDTLDVVVKNQPEPIKEVKISNLKDISKKVEVSNFPEQAKFPTEIKVNNLDEIRIPDRVEVKKPDWLDQLPKEDLLKILVNFLLVINKSKGVKVDLDKYKEVDNPLAVRLTNGKQFYTAIADIIASSGSAFPFITSTGVAKEALVDTEGHPQVDILTMPPVTVTIPAGDLQVGAVEIKNDTDDTRAHVGADGLEVEVKKSALPSGAATAAKQLADGHNVAVNNLPTEYPLPAAQVTTLTPPAVISGFATAAKQLPDNHQVTVSNPTADPETGLATSANQTDGSQITQVAALSTIYQGTKTCPTVAAEAITTTQVVHSVTIKALSTNTGIVYVGASGVTTANGFELLAGESVSLDVSNLATVFVIGSIAAQVVRYVGI